MTAAEEIRMAALIAIAAERITSLERTLEAVVNALGKRLRDHDLDIELLDTLQLAESGVLSDLQAEVASIDLDRLRAREEFTERLSVLEGRVDFRGVDRSYVIPQHLRHVHFDSLPPLLRGQETGGDHPDYRDANRGDFDR